MDGVNRTAMLQQEGDKQTRRGFDNASHMLLPARAGDGFQEQMQLFQALGRMIHPQWRLHLATSIVNDQNVMMGVTPINARLKHRPFLSFRKRSWGKRVLILWCSSKAQSPNDRLTQEHRQRSTIFLNRSSLMRERCFLRLVQQFTRVSLPLLSPSVERACT